MREIIPYEEDGNVLKPEPVPLQERPHAKARYVIGEDEHPVCILAKQVPAERRRVLDW